MKNQFESTPSKGERLSGEFLRKRKLLLFIPLLVLPFLTLAFWRLGSGTGYPKQKVAENPGINTSLPGPDLKNDKPQDKLGVYEQHKRHLAMANGDNAFAALGFDTAVHTNITLNNNTISGSSSAEANERVIHQRLAQIRQEIAKPTPSLVNPVNQTPAYSRSTNLDRMEKLVKSQNNQTSEDPEMRQLNAMLEKIIDIQHPERVNNQLQQQQPKPESDSVYKASRAIIAENQKVSQGSTVKLRIMDTLVIDNQIIPKGQFIYGICQVANQRLILNIKTIRLGTSILPVDLSVYDLDAMPGINAPEAITTNAIRSGSNNAVQSLQLTSMDQSITTQLAGAGVEAAKGLFGKKIKRIRVRLKGGYQVLLRNNQAKH
jgi:hypothetical protein